MTDNQKIRVSLPAYSMYTKTPIYHGLQAEVDGVQNSVALFGLLRDSVVADSTDVLYTVPQGGQNRLDLISQNFYGVPDLWWVIAAVNNMNDPVVSPTAGDVIRIPAKNRLATIGVLSV